MTSRWNLSVCREPTDRIGLSFYFSVANAPALGISVSLIWFQQTFRDRHLNFLIMQTRRLVYKNVKWLGCKATFIYVQWIKSTDARRLNHLRLILRGAWYELCMRECGSGILLMNRWAGIFANMSSPLYNVPALDIDRLSTINCYDYSCIAEDYYCYPLSMLDEIIISLLP